MKRQILKVWAFLYWLSMYWKEHITRSGYNDCVTFLFPVAVQLTNGNSVYLAYSRWSFKYGYETTLIFLTPPKRNQDWRGFVKEFHGILTYQHFWQVKFELTRVCPFMLGPNAMDVYDHKGFIIGLRQNLLKMVSRLPEGEKNLYLSFRICFIWWDFLCAKGQEWLLDSRASVRTDSERHFMNG